MLENQEQNTAHNEDSVLTKDIVLKCLPKAKKSHVTDEFIERLNASLTGSEVEREAIRNNFIGYMSVCADSNFSLDQYLSAVKFCSYKLMGDNSVTAYAKTFPDRYARILTDIDKQSYINQYAAAYNKGKLVNAIMAQSMVPTYVLNQDIHQKAINRLAHLMENAKSEKVQVDAASALLVQLKAPEAKKIDLNVEVKRTDGIAELNNTLMQMAEQQKKFIEAGHPTKTIAAQRIIAEEVEDAEFEELPTNE